MPAEGALPKPLCGSASVGLGSNGALLQGGNIGMPELARKLSLMLDRSVVDRTGFTGHFDLRMDFMPDETTPSMPPPPPGSDVSGASFPQVLRQSLGLQLESAKGPVEVIVVDSAGKPSGN